MGTPYEVETEGRVLFLEDIREAPYRVDRMLSQLRLAGKLDNVAAVVLGSFYKCEEKEGDETGLSPRPGVRGLLRGCALPGYQRPPRWPRAVERHRADGHPRPR